MAKDDIRVGSRVSKIDPNSNLRKYGNLTAANGKSKWRIRWDDDAETEAISNTLNKEDKDAGKEKGRRGSYLRRRWSYLS